MRTIPTDQAHKTLTTKHETLRWVSDIASVSVRKTNGKYCVRVENYETQQVFNKAFATLNGALLNAETMREWYL